MTVQVGDEENINANNVVKITIQGNDLDHLQIVEKKLQIEKYHYKLERKLIKYLIGQNGDRIRKIIENSQLIKIDFDNPNSSNSSEKTCIL